MASPTSTSLKPKSHTLAFLATTLLLSSCGNDEAANAKEYPWDVCIVLGEKLGTMGEPVSIVHEGQTVKFCCKPCIPEFERDPAMFIARLEGPPPLRNKKRGIDGVDLVDC